MSNHQSISQISPGELGMVDYDDRVVALRAVEKRHAGTALLVHVPDLVACLRDLPESVRTVVVLDDRDPDDTLAPIVGGMLAEHARTKSDVLAASAPVTEAIKRVHGDRVVGGISRVSLATIRCPEVIDRAVLAAALDGCAESWANPSGLVASRGGTIRLYPASGDDDDMSDAS